MQEVAAVLAAVTLVVVVLLIVFWRPTPGALSPSCAASESCVPLGESCSNKAVTCEQSGTKCSYVSRTAPTCCSGLRCAWNSVCVKDGAPRYHYVQGVGLVKGPAP